MAFSLFICHDKLEAFSTPIFVVHFIHIYRYNFSITPNRRDILFTHFTHLTPENV